MKKVFVPKLLIFLLLVTIFSFDIQAIEITSQDQLLLDTSITRVDTNFSTPEKIIVAPIFTRSDDIKMTERRRFRGIYYYLIQKLGFSDIPFHFVVSKNGEVFEGNKGGDERQVYVEGIGDNVILIGYLADNTSNSFDPRAESKLIDLISEVANRNSIRGDNIMLSGIKFVRDEANKTVNIESDSIFGNWNISFQGIKSAVDARYAPVSKEYKLDIASITLPEGELEPGSEYIVSLKLMNTGNTGIYSDTNSEILLTKTDGGDSRFFINNVWSSKSQVIIMQSGQDLAPGQEGLYDIKMKAPLYFGEISESFDIRTILGGRVNISQPVGIKINVKRGSKQIVEIQNTELGYLRVRSEPSSVGTEIGRVSSGERFIVLEDAGNGFIKLDLGDGNTGWVAAWLTTGV
jgi:hypothetical protein